MLVALGGFDKVLLITQSGEESGTISESMFDWAKQWVQCLAIERIATPIPKHAWLAAHIKQRGRVACAASTIDANAD